MKFIYFDVGGVLASDLSKTNKWDEIVSLDWGIPNDKKKEVNERFDLFENEACVGRNVEDFLLILKNDFGVYLPKNYSLLKDIVNRFETNEGIKEIVYECEKKYSLGLLTNMYPGMFDLIKQKKLLPKVEWKVIINSTEVKCKKPEEEIYQLAQKRAGVEAKDILFIDNITLNLEVPEKMGWKTWLFDSKDYEKSNEELRLWLK